MTALLQDEASPDSQLFPRNADAKIHVHGFHIFAQSVFFFAEFKANPGLRDPNSGAEMLAASLCTRKLGFSARSWSAPEQIANLRT
jgi:hypothetical protein